MGRASKTEVKLFKDRLNQEMDGKKCTATELAKELGISRQAVDNYRNGISDPPLSKLIQIADYFDVSVDWLLGRDGAVKTMDADIAAAVRCTGLTENAIKKLVELKKETQIPSINGGCNQDLLESLSRYAEFRKETERNLSTFIESGVVAEASEKIVFHKVSSEKLNKLLNGAVRENIEKMSDEEIGRLVREVEDEARNQRLYKYEAQEVVKDAISKMVEDGERMCELAFEKSAFNDLKKLSSLSTEQFIKFAHSVLHGEQDGEHPEADN